MNEKDPATPTTPANAANEHHRPIRSFVLRQGRQSPAQTRAVATLGPQFLLPYSAEGPLDYSAVFSRTAPTILEIGFGMGESTALIAEARKEHDFIGVEVHTPGVGSLLKQIGERDLSNVRIIQHDAVEVLAQQIAPASLAGVHVFFPDPWPKKRHHKRRLIQPAFVHELALRIQPGGYLHLATDWQEYAEQMLAVLSAETLLVNTAADYAPRPAYRPQTSFERKGLAKGHDVWDLVFYKT